jgi:hypothetical protein
MYEMGLRKSAFRASREEVMPVHHSKFSYSSCGADSLFLADSAAMIALAYVVHIGYLLRPTRNPGRPDASVWYDTVYFLSFRTTHAVAVAASTSAPPAVASISAGASSAVVIGPFGHGLPSASCTRII